MPHPLMPKATAVWLVDNTSLSFDQIADFCGLHALEVQGIADGEVAVSFDHVHGGLRTKGDELKGFAIAGADKKWRFANARIEGDSVVLSHSDVKQPEAVRYNWAANPIGNLFNGAGIPAAQFRTDDWKLNVAGR